MVRAVATAALGVRWYAFAGWARAYGARRPGRARGRAASPRPPHRAGLWQRGRSTPSGYQAPGVKGKPCGHARPGRRRPAYMGTVECAFCHASRISSGTSSKSAPERKPGAGRKVLPVWAR